MRIKFFQEVEFFTWDGEDPVQVKDPAILKTLHGVTHEEECSRYLLDGESDREKFQHLSISGGLIRLEYSEDRNAVFITTEYRSKNSLSEKDIQNLKEYTGSQWTDGAGSNFCQSYQFPADPSIGGNYGEIEHEVHS